MAKPRRWRYKVGPYGATVTVEERKLGGLVRLKAYSAERGGYVTRSLGFVVRDVEDKLIPEAVENAKAEAAKLSNLLLRHETLQRRVTLGQLADLFLKEELAKPNKSTGKPKSAKHVRELRAEVALLRRFFGKDFEVEKLGRREWNALSRQRASGEIDAHGIHVAKVEDRVQVGTRTVAKTLKALRHVCRFGAGYKRPGGGFLLSADPTRGEDLPSSTTAMRPIITDDEFEALLMKAPTVHPYLRTMLVLAGETGRRIGAIVALRYADWIQERGTFGSIRWRADSDKLGRESIIPVTSRVREEIERAVRERPGIGDAWLFPAPDSKGHVDVTLASRWWRRVEDAAEMPHRTWAGWHSLRRRWATKRKGLPLPDVARAGGWKGTQVLRDVYMSEDPETIEQVVLGGRKLERRA